MLTKDQAEAVASYLLTVFPGSGLERQHAFMSAWQMASEALEALGYAVETSWGIVLHAKPVEPAVLPRWDDMSVVVLLAAEQSGRIRLAGCYAANLPTGPVTADELSQAALESLGLVADRRWTVAAREVLWRVAPEETDTDFRGDGRLNHVLREKVPDEVLHEIERARDLKNEVVRKNQLDHVFFEKWRLDDGWLNDEAGGRALMIFHDPLAQEAAARFDRASGRSQQIHPLAGAVVRSIAHRDKLKQMDGEMLSSSQVENLLGIERQALDERCKAHKLLALRMGAD